MLMELYDIEEERVVERRGMTELDAAQANHEFRERDVFRRWVPARTFIDSKSNRRKELQHATQTA